MVKQNKEEKNLKMAAKMLESFHAGRNGGKTAKDIPSIPYKFNPRPYQIPIFQAVEQGYKRLISVWHRRAGKDKTFFNIMVREAVQKVGLYYYLFPTYAQGRKILWEGIDGNQFRNLDHIPKEMVKSRDNQEMKIELTNGSIIRVIGTDRIDTIVGTNPIGCIFSEYSLQDPTAWDFIRPILDENGGWALFNFTPRGKNHAYRLLESAKQNPEIWYTSILNVEDTQAIPADVLERARLEIIEKNGDDAIFRQEYYCDFNGGLQGSYYASLITKLDDQKKITSVPYEPALPVHTAWDLGVDDSTVIWFFQVYGKEFRIIDYYEDSNEGLPYYVRVLKEKTREYGYAYGDHFFPWDVTITEFGTGKTRLSIARELLGPTARPVKKLQVVDGIDYVRRLLPRCWFDAQKCKRGIDALMAYRKDWNEKLETYKASPVHDWSSHAADAFRYLAVGYLEDRGLAESRPVGMKKYGASSYFDGKLERTIDLVRKLRI